MAWYEKKKNQYACQLIWQQVNTPLNQHRQRKQYLFIKFAIFFIVYEDLPSY